MAVLVEGISVVVRKSQIDAIYPGGWGGFVADCPNKSLCADSDLARVGFMTPADVESYCRRLTDCGLVFLANDSAVDLAVVDQIQGPTVKCDWLEFGHITFDEHRVAACRFVGSADDQVVTPEGWRYEKSLSASHSFVPSEAVHSSLRLLRSESGLDVFLNRLTGKEVYVGRTGVAPLSNPTTDK